MVDPEEIARTEEGNIAKFMQLGQLIIEYLLFTQDQYRGKIFAQEAQCKDFETQRIQRDSPRQRRF